MGFHQMDDSDLEPERRDYGQKGAKNSKNSKNMKQASFDDEEYVSKKSRKKKKKKEKKESNSVLSYIWTFFKVLGTTVGIFVIGIGILIYCSMAGWLGDVGEIDLQTLLINTDSEVYYIDPETGKETLMGTLNNGDNHSWVDSEDIPKDMKNAFVAIEDERFYKHSGFDLLRTTKATAMWGIGKITGKGSDFGGSTITQQLVKNVTGDWDNTPTRKIKEISQAVNLEKQLTKDEILELYLNVIYLDRGCYGVESASHEYFGKPTSELNLAECASIAGITQNPSLYDPITNPENNKKKQEIVLKKMYELGYINKDKYEKAKAYKLSFRKGSDSGEREIKINDYYLEYIRQSLIDEFCEMGYSTELASRKACSSGLKIITTVDPKVQGAIDDVYANDAVCTAIFGFKPGDENTPQSAVVVIDPYDGSIKGLYGGLGKKKANLILNRATIPRQPGSSIKPISVYSEAIEEGVVNASTVYSDERENFNGWSPKNSYSGGGSKTVSTAIMKSSNIIAARVLRDLGINHAYSHLENDLKITSLTEDDKNLPALALGGLTKGISPLQMAAAYTPFLNDGIYTQPYIYTKVYDRSGNIIINHKVKTNQAISRETAYIMTQLLRRVVTSGTGTAAQLSGGIFTAGKTGTTDDNRDKWFIGVTPNYITAIWHGYDKNQKVTAYTGGSQAAFKRIMDKAYEGVKVKSISAPSGVKMISVCSDTGKIASSGCHAISLPFTDDNKPTKHCYHKASSSHNGDNETKSEEIVDVDNPKKEENEGGETSASGGGNSGAASGGTNGEGASPSGEGAQ